MTPEPAKYCLQDMHGQFVSTLDREELSRLKFLGVVQSYGNKKRTLGYRLTCPLSSIDGYDYSEPSYVPANYSGTRFSFKEHVNLLQGKALAYYLKDLDVTESPEHALLRILTPQALEASTYQPLASCTEEERLANPAYETRKRNRDIFRLGRLTARRRPKSEEPTPKYKPVCAPLFPVALPAAA